jgi:hypothetical protein
MAEPLNEGRPFRPILPIFAQLRRQVTQLQQLRIGFGLRP